MRLPAEWPRAKMLTTKPMERTGTCRIVSSSRNIAMSPSVMRPAMISRPPNQKTAASESSHSDSITGSLIAWILLVWYEVSKSSSARSSNFSCSNSSREKDLTTRWPVRFSCSTVESCPWISCTRIQTGRSRSEITLACTAMMGMKASPISPTRQFVSSSSTAEATTRMTM